MNFKIQGKLIEKFDEQVISDKFKKREFVIEVENERNPEWNDVIKFQLTQDRCVLIDDFSLNSEVEVNFNIRGRKFEKDGKVNYFSNLEAWRIEKTRSEDSPVPEMPEYTAEDTPPAPEEDDLPF